MATENKTIARQTGKSANKQASPTDPETLEQIEEKQEATNDGSKLEQPSAKAKKQAGTDNLDDKESARLVTELVECAGGDLVVQALHGLQAQITGTTPIEREAGRIAARDALRKLGK
jgi:hypothetical protein